MKLKNLQWKNIYHMMCYAIDELKYFEEYKIDFEKVSGTNDLLARLLCKAFDVVYNNGYIKRYSEYRINTCKPRGRMNIAKSYSKGLVGDGKISCTIDRLDINNVYNQIIKSAFILLIEANRILDDKISDNVMSQLYSNMGILDNVDKIEISEDTLNIINDVPEWYKPIYVVCKLILKDWLACDRKGNNRLLWLNDQARLKYIFEKFVRQYYTKEYANAITTRPSYKIYGRNRQFDMMLENNNTNSVLIIDTKWYESGDRTIANEDQINAYVGAVYEDTGFSGYGISGCLMYAVDTETKISKIGTDDKSQYTLATWEININQEFNAIKDDLIRIAGEYL